MKKIMLIIFCVILLFGVGVSVFKNDIVKYFIKKTINNLGVLMDVANINVNIIGTSILAEDIVVYNPEGFQQKELAQIPELFIDFELKDFLTGKVHFREIKFNLSNLYIEKTKDGKINLNQLNVSNGEGSSSQKQTDYKIDKLVLTLGHVKAVDYSKKLVPQTIETDMGVKDEVFNDVTDVSGIIDIIISKIISNNLFLGFQIMVGNVASTGLNVVTKPMATVGKGVGTGVGKMGQGMGKIAETILPFGKKTGSTEKTTE